MTLIMLAEIGLVIIGCLIVTTIVRALRIEPRKVEKSSTVPMTVDSQSAIHHLAGAVRIRTTSHLDVSQIDYPKFLDLHRYLEVSFPLVHQTLQREIVARYSLLYTWQGQDINLKPALLMGHLDVVPIEEGTEKNWICPPFEGKIEEGYLWGRGTMDDKNAVIGILEAVEGLLRGGFQPKRTIYLAFGHDEEIGGSGAAQIAAIIRSRGIKLECVLDEGLAIIDGILPGIKKPFALIGVAEKGYLSVELRVDSSGGHAAMPPRETAIGILSKAMLRLEQNQMPAHFQPPTSMMFAYLVPEMIFSLRLVVSNLWMFKGLLINRLSAMNTVNAMIRTTTAPTIFSSGFKDNILPIQARGAVNFRLLQGDTVDIVLKHVQRIIADRRVKVIPAYDFCVEASPVSNVDANSFHALERTLMSTFPDITVAPGLVAGATDSRHYTKLTDSVYRFSPLWIKLEDLNRVHGTNERIGVETFHKMVQFYAGFIRELSTV
jgi:carboxypeptidase PM20D1